MASGRMLRTFVLFLALFSVYVLLLQSVAATGVGVTNVPPTFPSILISEGEDGISIVVNVSDYNGWADIYMVSLVVTDGSQDLLVASYKQYLSNTSRNRVDLFEVEYMDSSLQERGVFRQDTSRVRRFSDVGWFEENTMLEITFNFRIFNGRNIRILAEDVGGETAVHVGPFSASHRVPTIFDDRAIPFGISIVCGVAAGGIAVFDRLGSNRMARAIARMRSGGMV